MKHATLRLICALLAALMLTAALAACADAEKPDDTTTEPVTTAATPDTTPESTELVPDVPDSDFGGHKFNVLTRGQYSQTWYSRDIYSDGSDGGYISVAVFRRNKKIEEKYHFEVVEIASQEPHTTAKNSVETGLDEYDMYCFSLKDHITSLITAGYLRDLRNVDYLDLDKPYYDQNSINSLSIGGKVFVVTGDLLTMDNDATRCVLFNKELFEELALKETLGGNDLYKLTDDKKWTLEKMMLCSDAAVKNIDGNDVMDINDRWGIVTEQFNALAFYNGAGKFLFEKDADDKPYFNGGDEASLNTIEKIITALNSDSVRTFTNSYTEAMPQFKDGLVLFFPCQLANVPLLRDMDFDFGILPTPLGSEDQERYYSPVTAYGSNCIAIPTSVQDVGRAAIIIEALSCESMYTVTPAYYDVTLYSKLVKDYESTRSLDIILSTAVFELGYMWNWGQAYGQITNAFNTNNPNLAAKFQSIKKVSAIEIKNLMDSISKIKE